ncbi:TIGR04219 family outer membrane beta-barrel protein [Marinomonas sp. C2222]|uniref:TIGR04219 family outer membrane beta-barrel protein n=1 Tax=Marinomonas sargassi TaxID=2984494 RepID=A0ABT2YUZ6_9GAMM|nr:TIGR04219 family outer membrane beta-barrel protein [Marinomonas sargassi]MCV2403727.1 TIGR04219 family outer membrane beta-barrel protein [Marinomonas sargassi]
MKLFSSVFAFSILLLTSTAHADFIGANVEVGGFKTEADFKTNSSNDFVFEDSTGTYFSIDVQHPIPLIPNARVDTFEFDVDGKSGTTDSTLDVSLKDVTGYYGISLLWVGVEAGLLGRNISINYTEGGTDKNASNALLPMYYLSAKLSIPGTNIQIAAESKQSIDLQILADLNMVEDANDSASDVIYKIAYQPIPILGLEVGYREMNHIIDSVTMDHTGYFLGVTIDI